MSKPEIEIIEPNYEGLAKVIDSLKDLYQMNGITSSMIETCLRHLMQPPTILHNNPNRENLDIGPKPTNEITKEEVNELIAFFNRLCKMEAKERGVDSVSDVPYIARVKAIIQKLENNGK